MKQIPLTQGKFALVDDEDFDELNKYKWCAHNNKSKFYALRGLRIDGKTKTIYMHKFLMNTPKGMVTDHIDGDGLNNQKFNLRICTDAENLRNQSKKSNNKSGLKGVSWSKSNKKWYSQIKINYKSISLGLFSKKEDAYNAYCEACIKYHGYFSNVGGIKK